MTDDPFDRIGRLIDGSDDAGDAFSPPPPFDDVGTPHPAGGGAPEWQGDDEVVPADNQRPADAGTLSRDVLLACAGQPQNDTGNGQRLLSWFGSDLLHVRSNDWHAWTGTHWRREGGNEVATHCAQITAARIVLEADMMAATPSEQRLIDAADQARDAVMAIDKKGDLTDADKAMRRNLMKAVEAGDDAAAALKARQIARWKYAVSSGNSGKIEGMIKQALPHRVVGIDRLDPNKLAFNVENGTIHFVATEEADPDAGANSTRTVKRYKIDFKEHDQADNISKCAPVTYDPAATAPQFEAATLRFQPIGATRKFLQRYHGYAMTGLTGEQCLIFNYGMGSNWKSTFIEIVARVMGDYCATIGFESLAGDAQKSGSQASPDIARLPGSRLVRASEPERGVQFKEALIKSLTGGEPMLTRHNFGAFFEFRPDFKLVLSGNHKPQISGVDHGIWRRIKFVLWPTTIADHEKRPMDEVISELWAERSGILNWLLAGALDYLNDGLQTPQEVIDATAAYREEQDPVGNFVGMCIESVPMIDGKPAAIVPAREMYDAFAAWASVNAVRPWREKSFAEAMSTKGFETRRHAAGQRYINVRLQNVPKAQRPRPDEPPHPAADVVPI